MNKNKFLKELKEQLDNLPETEKKDILYDYEEHFRIGVEKGKKKEEITRNVGNAKAIEKQFKEDYSIKRAEKQISIGNITKAILATVSIGFFNIVFILGIFLGFVGILVGLFAAAFGLIVGGAGAILGLILAPLFPTVITVSIDASFVFFAAIGTTSLGLLLFIGDCYLAKIFYKTTLKYLKWNIEIVKSTQGEK